MDWCIGFLSCSKRGTTLYLSFWTSFWARKNPCGSEWKWLIRLGKSAIIVICPIGTRDSSLRSEWHAKGDFYHSKRATTLYLSFWTSFWARKNPCGSERKWLIRLGKSAIIVICPIGTRDSSLRSEWHTKRDFCHSELTFRRDLAPEMA